MSSLTLRRLVGEWDWDWCWGSSECVPAIDGVVIVIGIGIAIAKAFDVCGWNGLLLGSLSMSMVEGLVLLLSGSLSLSMVAGWVELMVVSLGYVESIFHRL